MGFARAVGELATALVSRPSAFSEPARRAREALVDAGWATVVRSFGARAAAPGPVPSEPGDRRFRDPAWTDNPWFFGIGQSYLAWSRYLRELVDAADLDRPTAEKAACVVDQVIDALAPTNFFWSNPTAVRRAVETGGLSVVRGARNFVRDVSTNGGKPAQVDRSAFRLGENLAATPGKVVFRNDLMELIQYSPQTETVFETPLLLSPPWINKYYIMDLAPGRSFVEWAVQHGHTVFAISYRNPDASMRGVALDDYLLHGPHTALDVIADITGAKQANIVGLCLGGTLTAMLLAYLKANGEDRVRSATLLNTLIDFAEPGPMGCFLDRESVEHLSERMLEQGYLDAADMSSMFDLLRARDLIWSYVASGWLMGDDPPAFDILAWNADGTRMPAEMHSFYLRYCYVENQLARGEMTLGGQQLNLGEVGADTYLLSAKEDHIAPWKSSYAATSVLGGDVRFVLSSSGHVAGIVNPPGSRRVYWTNDTVPAAGAAADEWLASATEHEGSWWQDWTSWIADRAGARRKPPRLGSKKYPARGDAPGEYVHET
ncbi:MAG: PHA/PHB synthase family protein [Acidimicrobiales bacterium]